MKPENQTDESKSKMYALRRDVHLEQPLYVYDRIDWDIMLRLPPGSLMCPQPGCRTPLYRSSNKQGTRWLRLAPNSADCRHKIPPGGGGVMTSEHLWLQQRIHKILTLQKHESVIEHQPSNSDIWVKSTPPLSIEVQKWSTDFAKRTAAREALGAKVLWLMPESATGQAVGSALFSFPAARVRVFSRTDRTRVVTPWMTGHDQDVRLQIGATVMRLSQDGQTLIGAKNYDAWDFLREVLDGQRCWFGPAEPGFAYGSGWARLEDVERMRATKRREVAARSDAAAPLQSVPPAPKVVDVASIERDSATAVPAGPTLAPAPADGTHVTSANLTLTSPPQPPPPADKRMLAATTDTPEITAHAAQRHIDHSDIEQPGPDGANPSDRPKKNGWLDKLKAWFH